MSPCTKKSDAIRTTVTRFNQSALTSPTGSTSTSPGLDSPRRSARESLDLRPDLRVGAVLNEGEACPAGSEPSRSPRPPRRLARRATRPRETRYLSPGEPLVPALPAVPERPDAGTAHAGPLSAQSLPHRDQRPAPGPTCHPTSPPESALNHSCRVQERLGSGELHLDRSRLRVDSKQSPSQRRRRRRERRPSLYSIPKRALSLHRRILPPVRALLCTEGPGHERPWALASH